MYDISLLRSFSTTLIIAICVFLSPGCTPEQAPDVAENAKIAIIPAPAQITKGEGNFQLKTGLQISVPPGDASWAKSAAYFVERILFSGMKT